MMRRALILLVFVTLLAACGAPPAAQSPSAAPATTVAPAAITASAATSATAATDAPVASAYPRTVIDGVGQPVIIPAKPQRIAVLDPLASLEALLSLGVAPVQIGQRSFVAEFTGDPLRQWPWLEKALTDTGANPERISADETNIEAVARANPDLIIGQPFWVDERRDLLNGIAPTVATPVGDVRQSITLLGEVLGMEQQAAQVLADWDARIQSEVAGLAPAGKQVAIIRTDGEGTFTAFNAAGYGPYDMLIRAGFRGACQCRKERCWFGVGVLARTARRARRSRCDRRAWLLARAYRCAAGESNLHTVACGAGKPSRADRARASRASLCRAEPTQSRHGAARDSRGCSARAVRGVQVNSKYAVCARDQGSSGSERILASRRSIADALGQRRVRPVGPMLLVRLPRRVRHWKLRRLMRRCRWRTRRCAGRAPGPT
jgi:ABC-type Fe3+-hydroxamate transport system substrate-binding protein